jgi:hypothetical protein
VTPGWLTEQLQRAGHAGAVVESFSSERIGTGQIGQCHRYTLDYRAWNSSAPATLIGKFPSDDEQSRATAVALRNYYLEVCFYRELAGQLSIRTPHCYYADIVGEGPEFALLLEDLQPARQGDQLKGCSPAVAGRAVLELVGLQAPFWCDERLHDLAWLANSPDAVASGVQELYRQTLPGFRERYAGLLAPEQMAIFDALGESADPALFRAPERWFCLEHGDYRLDNMLIDERGDELAIAVVDWQTYRVGKPLNDVAYAIGAGLLPDDRRPAEESIVRAYHKALCEAGIDNLDWEECWKEYRQATLSGFPITVIASVMAGRTERGDAMFLAMADRHSRHALDHGAASFL